MLNRNFRASKSPTFHTLTVSLHSILILNTYTKHILRQVIIPSIVFLLGCILLKTEWSSSYLKLTMTIIGAGMCFIALLLKLIRKYNDAQSIQEYFFKTHFRVGFGGLLVMILVGILILFSHALWRPK